MDLLFKNYASPLEFMKIYIDLGRFDEFVEQIVEIDLNKQLEAKQKDDENKLWNMYIHSYSDKSFSDWKEQVLNGNNATQPDDLSMTNEEVNAQVEHSRNILKHFNNI